MNPTPSRAARQTKLRRLRLATGLGFAAAFALVFGAALGPGQMLLGHDAVQLFLPLKRFLAHELAAGRWPAWYPYDGLGISVPGAFVAAPLDPLNVLLLLLRPAPAVKWMILLSYPIAAAGALLLGRALGLPRTAAAFGGLAFALSGVMLSQSVSLQYVGAFSRIPWALWAALRLAQTGRLRWGAVLGLALASTLWSGDPQTLVLTTAATLALIAAHRHAWRRSLAPLLLGGPTAGLFCAPLLLPALRLFTGSARAAGLDPEEALSWSLHPVRLAELALGSPFSRAPVATLERFGAQNGGFWSDSIYAGTLVAALALLGLARRGARWRWAAAGMAAGALLLSLGRYAGLYAHVPPLMHFRYPEKLVVWAALPLALLAARGLAGLRGRLGTRRWMIALAVPLACGFAALAVEPTFMRPLIRGVLLLGALALVARLTRGQTRLVLVATLAILELGVANREILLYGPIDTWLPAHSPMPEAQPGERICSDLGSAGLIMPPGKDGWQDIRRAQLDTLGYGLAGLYDLRSTLGLTPVWPAEIVKLCSVADICGTACARLEGARLQWIQRSALQPLLATGGYRLVRESAVPEAALVEDLRAPPYASVRPARLYDEAFPTIVALHQGRIRAGSEALLARAEAPEAEAWRGSGSAEARSDRPDRIQIQATASAPAVLVVEEAYSPDWRATVDGVATKPLRADFGMLGIPLTAGSHEVRLENRPFGVPWSTLAYALGWLLLGGVWVFERRRA